MRAYPTYVAVLLIWTAGIGQAWGSSIIPPKNYGQMVALSDAVVLGEAVHVEVAPLDGLPRTRVRLRVYEAFKGKPGAGETIILDFLGGAGESGATLLSGSPHFEPGGTYLLCLNETDRGWSPWLLSYGQMALRRLPNGQEAFVHLEASHQLNLVGLGGGPLEPVTAYAKNRLLAHVADVARGAAAWDRGISGELAYGEAHKTSSEPPFGCSFLQTSPSADAPMSRPLRWSRFGRDEPVRVHHAAGASAKQIADLGTSLTNWKAVPEIDLSSLGAAGGLALPSCGALPRWTEAAENAGRLFVVFDDPCGLVDDAPQCVGLLAVSLVQPADPTQTHVHRGETWAGLHSGMLIMNNGVSGCLSPERYQQVVQHELGHLLGFGHHTNEPAAMNAACCNPITDKDVACAQYAYGTLALNPTPMVARLDPVELAQGETREVDVVGSGFMPETAVAVGGTHVAVQAVSMVDSGLLRVRIAVADDAEPSVRAFRLTNPKPGGGRSADAGIIIVPRVGTSGPSLPDKPFGYALENNYPNPFNPTTMIPFTLPAQTRLKLSAVDLSGREVRLLAEGEYGVGRHAVAFDASGLASGLYLIRLESERGVRTSAVLFLK